MKQLFIYLFFGMLCINTATEANIATLSSEMSVTASVVKFCKTSNYAPFIFSKDESKSLTVTAIVTVTCTAGTVYSITSSKTEHVMTNEHNDRLLYSLYRDPEGLLPLGNIIGENTISGVGTGKNEIITIYANIKADQIIGSGTYQDRLDINLSF